ncbi:MAG: rplS [Candidatus Saccharibacteria bacterium]|nr:rplS [Candidatus Saccharibacteria bacterium]
MQSIAQQIQAKHMKHAVVDIKSGDTVRVHQKIVEGGKERVQIFEGLIIKVSRRGSLTQTFTVRRISSGIGVEKSYLIHSPNILKVEVVRRSRVRRNYLTYMRARTGKSARLTSVDFDRGAVNTVEDKAAEAEEAKIHDQQLDSYDPEAAKEEKAEAKEAQSEATAEPAKTEVEKLEENPVLKASGHNPAEDQNKEK